MRLTIGLAAMASLCLLAGCNKGAANNSANAPAANATAPVENATPPAETPANGAATAGGEDRRTGAISQCVAGAPEHLPAGTDANAFCSCAVDKMLTNNTPQPDAINQCATEMHITLINAGQ